MEPLVLERDEADFTFWQQATPGTTYVRGILPARALNGQCLELEDTDLQWDGDLKAGIGHMYMPRQKGASVWQFLGDEGRTRIPMSLKDQGWRVLMDVDDNYIHPYPVPKGRTRAWWPTIAEAHPFNGYSNEMHRFLTPMLDGVIVSTEYLKQIYQDYNDHVYLCPNMVDPKDWTDLAEKDPDVLRIVYSGSPSHFLDIPLLTKALKWASRQPGVEIHLQGVESPGWSFDHWYVPWVDSPEAYRKSLGAFDIGVAPLIENKWSKGKSDLKALEYTMAGVMPIVGRSEPYRPWWPMEGFVVENDERAWLDKIKWIVKNRDAVKDFHAEAKRYVMNHRVIYDQAHLWKEAISA